MTEIEEIRSVIEKIESHDGSAALDLEIWNLLSKDNKGWRFFDIQRETITYDRFGPDAVGNPVLSLDQFTRSIDAAITLVPDGFDWGFSWSKTQGVETFLRGPKFSSSSQCYQGYISTKGTKDVSAIARGLCIAKLEYMAAAMTAANKSAPTLL